MQYTSLRTGIGINAKRVVVGPCDMKATRLLHHPDGPVCSTLIPHRDVFIRIPCICDTFRLIIQR